MGISCCLLFNLLLQGLRNDADSPLHLDIYACDLLFEVEDSLLQLLHLPMALLMRIDVFFLAKSMELVKFY